ncbi:PRKC apoptosis WT1 regulator protein-like isoform X1 [Saccostrea cucullata]|uniref:PRKC apoptosis WT1 regulator protein-like isoform X1 n=1 Tax=Saccostrea cuccullata TaxID=36930 RepID=UPI002ED639FA
MASSSVSQESLDIEDYEISSRQSRVRRARALMPKIGDGYDRESPRNGDGGGDVIPEHESPSRSTAASRARDKRRPNHLHKGKLPKDKRKLREKRRSTGVVNLPSTESTGDSLDDEDDEELLEAKKNTSYNEVIDADNPQTPSESRVPRPFSSRRSNKSPSDLEADLEDNQDYDSTVSQSETNLTLIGKSDSVESSNQNASPKMGQGQQFFGRSTNHPDIPKSFRNFSPNTSENETKTSPSYSSNSSSPSSILNRYKWRSPDVLNQEREPPSSGTGISSIISKYDRKPSETETNSTTGFTSKGYRNFGDRFRKESPFQSQFRSVAAPTTREDAEKINLKKMLEKEQEENKKMKELLEDKDRRIAELEREVYLLNKDLEDMDDEAQKLQLENNALIRAVSQLSTQV